VFERGAPVELIGESKGGMGMYIGGGVLALIIIILLLIWLF
jgi:hypothetical protein